MKYTAPPLEELIRWRLWNRTSAGVMAELGSHQLDAASIFIGAMHARASKDPNSHPLVHPISVAAVGNRNIYDWDREIEDHMSCIIEFPGPEYNAKDALGRLKTITVAYTALSGNNFGGYGETVLGTKGTIVLEEEQKYMLYSTDAAPDSTVASTKIGVTKVASKDKDSAVLDTQASGGPAAAVGAAARADQPRLPRGAGALGLVHPQPRPEEPAAVPPRGRPEGRGDRPDHEPRRPAAGADRV